MPMFSAALDSGNLQSRPPSLTAAAAKVCGLSLSFAAAADQNCTPVDETEADATSELAAAARLGLGRF